MSDTTTTDVNLQNINERIIKLEITLDYTNNHITELNESFNEFKKELKNYSNRPTWGISLLITFLITICTLLLATILRFN